MTRDRSFMAPTLNMKMLRSPFADVAYICVPQFEQKPWARGLPLSPIFTYSFGVPLVNLKFSVLAGALTRNAVDERVWQSVQWHVIAA